MRDKALWISRLKDFPDGSAFAIRKLLTDEEIPEFLKALEELNFDIEARISTNLDRAYIRVLHRTREVME